MQLRSAVAESAHTPVVRTSPEADQHASMAASCLVHGLIGIAIKEERIYIAEKVVWGRRDIPWRGLTFNLSICIVTSYKFLTPGSVKEAKEP